MVKALRGSKRSPVWENSLDIQVSGAEGSVMRESL